MSDTAVVTEHAIYLYCLARPECLAVLQNLSGVDEHFPVTALCGCEGSVVAVISEVDPAEFSEQNLQMLSWLGVRAQRHEAVVERVMASSPLLPVKFGTLFRSLASLQAYLGLNVVSISRALDELRGLVEWSVKVYLAESVARPLVVARDEDIQSKIAAMPASPGARYIQLRQLESKIEVSLNIWINRLAEAIQSELIVHAVASTRLRRHSSAITGRPERMVFNRSYLLSDMMRADFRAALARQQAEYLDSGISLVLQGPWPPYNFCPTLAGSES